MTCDIKNVNNNILDDDFIKLYKPLIYIQTMLGSARVRIRHKRILMPLRIQTGYSIVFVAANVAAVIIAESSRSHDDKMLVMILVQIYQGLFVNICIIFFNNTLNRGCMMELLLTLQSIDRELKVIGKSRHTNKIYTVMITCTTTILVMMAMHAAQIIVYLDPSKILYFIFSFFIYFNMDFEFIFFVTVMIHLHNRVCYINELIAFGCEVHWQQKHMETEVYNRIWKAIVGAGRALRLIEKIFRVYVLLLGVHFFMYHMVASEKIILMPEMSIFSWRNLLIIPDILRYKSIGRISIISIIGHHLEASVLRTQEICIRGLRSRNAYSRRYMKNIHRLISNTMEPMTVYNLFPINNVAAQFIIVTTQYSIVLFLSLPSVRLTEFLRRIKCVEYK